MRRSNVRGRVFPQSYSTDGRYGRLGVKACILYPLLWANGDDQGRLSGDPDEVKYAVCPNIDHVAKSEIPGVLEDLQRNGLIHIYTWSGGTAIQLLDWWQVHRPQWAYPSEYAPPEGWTDRLRYHVNPREIVTENWIPPSQLLRSAPPSVLGQTPPHTPPIEKEEEEGRGRRGSTPRSALRNTRCDHKQSDSSSLPASPLDNLSTEDRKVIEAWHSVKGFHMSDADAGDLVRMLRADFPDVDLLQESRAWAARKISEPLKPGSRPSSQLWNWMEKRRQFDQERGGTDEPRISKPGRGHGGRRAATDQEREDSIGRPLY